ncbi:Uma2 family endonuclease [Pseudanabaenaceae cyanobacterium LEGE 13415]|nr:Uma2 family endonuclease [Pseudanabaenaceae cyanobacterium LEGE 13415]
MIQSQIKRLTSKEYLAYDDGKDTRYELVDGELIEMPPESPENLAIARRIFLELIKRIPAELIVWGTEIAVSGRLARYRLPDLIVHSEESYIALVGKSRSTITHEMPSPAIVIEVVSPGTTNRDRDYRHKRTEYAARCIPEYWIIDPETQQITICSWDNGQYEDQIRRGEELLQSKIVSNFALTVNQIFNPSQI